MYQYNFSRTKNKSKPLHFREELHIENTTYRDKLDEETDKINSIKHRIASDVVMLSHVSLKLHYVKQETNNLTCEEAAIDQSLINNRLVELNSLFIASHY